MNTLIKQIRSYLNLSQTEFAGQLAASFQTVNRWEYISRKIGMSVSMNITTGEEKNKAFSDNILLTADMKLRHR